MLWNHAELFPSAINLTEITEIANETINCTHELLFNKGILSAISHKTENKRTNNRISEKKFFGSCEALPPIKNAAMGVIPSL